MADRSTYLDAMQDLGTVLVVDDEQVVLDVTAEILAMIGIDVATALTGREAVTVLEQRADEVSLVLLDVSMPGMDGEQTFRMLKRIRPDVRVILCSGLGEAEAQERFGNLGTAGFIQKPYGLEALLEKFREVMDA